MGKFKHSRDAGRIARAFAAMLKKAFATIDHTGITAPAAGDIAVHLPEGDKLLFGMTMELTIAPGVVLPLDVNAIMRDRRMRPELEKAAAHIAEGLRWIWEDRDNIAAAIDAARPRVEEALAQARAQNLQMTLVEIGPERETARRLCDRGPVRHERAVRLRAVVEGLNDMLVPANEEILGWNGDEIADSIAAMLEMQRIRRDRWILLDDAGATGIIDTLALRIMHAAGADLSKALRDLKTSGWTKIDARKVTGDDESLTISLAMPSPDGVAQVGVRLSDTVVWDNDRLVIRDMTLPETFKLALMGQPVTKLVEHPLLLEDMIITDLVEADDELHVNVTMPTRFYDAETTRIWQ